MSKLSLIAALALGGLMACSTLATAQDAPKKKGMTVEARLEQMTTTLSLTDAEKLLVKPVLEATSKAMQKIRNNTDLDQQARRDAMKPIMETQNTAMEKILTPEQYKKYTEMNQRGKKGSKKQAP